MNYDIIPPNPTGLELIKKYFFKGQDPIEEQYEIKLYWENEEWVMKFEKNNNYYVPIELKTREKIYNMIIVESGRVQFIRECYTAKHFNKKVYKRMLLILSRPTVSSKQSNNGYFTFWSGQNAKKGSCEEWNTKWRYCVYLDCPIKDPNESGV